MPLSFGVHDDVVFDKSPLLMVLTQIQFSPVLALLTDRGAVGFQELIRPNYPKFTTGNQAAVNISPGSLGIQQAPPVYRFSTSDEQWTIGLSAGFVSVETTAYTGFDEFRRRVDQVLRALSTTIHPNATARIGLRKINELHLEQPADKTTWHRSINRVLLGPLAETSLPADVNFSFSDLRFTEDVNILAVRYGINPDPNKSDTYLIDQDYFTERPSDLNGDLNALLSILDHFSEGMTSFFHWATTSEYRDSLLPRPRQLSSTAGTL